MYMVIIVDEVMSKNYQIERFYTFQSDLINEGHGQHANAAEMDTFCKENGFIKWQVKGVHTKMRTTRNDANWKLGLRHPRRIIPTLMTPLDT